MRRRVVTCVVSALLLATAAGCDADGADGGSGGGGKCAEGDPAVVKQVMAGARKDFRPVLADGSPGVHVDHLELLDSSVGRLPEKDRKFGADQLLVVAVSTVLGDEDASDGIAGFDGTTIFALDADGKLLGPAGAFTASLFDLTSPSDPGWLAWGDKVETSSLAGKLYGCVDPD